MSSEKNRMSVADEATLAKLSDMPLSNRNRPVPFWSWNARLDAEECRRQISQMNEQGIGGFFMHARGGLATPYLSDGWFAAVKASIAEARKLGMNAWAYDENGWPSGFGGGLVNGKGLFFQQKFLRCKHVFGAEDPRKTENLLALFDMDGRLHPDGVPFRNQECYLAFCYEVNPYYVDTLDARVIAEFLRCTHEEYYRRLDADERAAMRGFFTDEPQISRNGIPWSFILEDEYRARYGEELLPLLPQLLYDWGRDYRRTRYRFWRLVTELFSRNYMKQIHDWCEEHGWELTGHLVHEDTLLYQLPCNGACMPHYEYFHVPGMDLLGRELDWVSLPLQLFSAAAQTGKRQILSETFACCGWAVNFADMQAIVQRQLVHGVNLVCQHLESYSLKGLRKRDFPASLFRHQPWWPYYKPFNDYLARLGTLLERGEVRYDVLLIHPQSTAWCCFDNANNGAGDLYDQAFRAASVALESRQIHHHYGDEILMERHGGVEDGCLRIGEQRYRLVILPKLANLSARQVELLEGFVAQGGRVLGLRNDLEPIPFAVDGETGAPCPLLRKVEWFDTMEELIAAIPKVLRPVEALLADGTPAALVNSTRRFFRDFDGRPAVFYYFINDSRTECFDVELRLPAKGIEGYDTHTGERFPVSYSVDGDSCRVPAHFSPGGDFALLAREEAVAPAAEMPASRHALTLAREWDLSAQTENLLVLDHCRCVADGEELFAREYVLTVNDALLARERVHQRIALEFDFQIGDGYDFGKSLDLLIEEPSWHRVFVNDAEVSNVSHGFFADPAFERLDITSAVRSGRNVIRLETDFHQEESTYACIRAAKLCETERNKYSPDSEVEAIYLAGSFGVRTRSEEFEELSSEACRYHGDFALVALPTVVQGDCLERSGLPFFAGTAQLSQEVMLTAEEAALPSELRFREFYGNVLVCVVNGRQIAALTRPEYVAAIPAGVLHEGANRIDLKIVTSLRNLFGPFHLASGDSQAVGPVTFYKTQGGPFTPTPPAPWNDGYCLCRVGSW